MSGNQDKNKFNTNGREERFDIKIEKPQKESKARTFLNKNLRIIIFFEIVIIFIIAYFVAIAPQVKSLTSDFKLIQDKKEKLQEIKKYKDDIETLKQSRDSLISQNNNNIQKLSEILPQKQNLPELMAQIEALVNSYGLVLGSIQMDAPQESTATASTTQASTVKKTNPKSKTQTEGTSSINSNIKEVQITMFVLGGTGSYDKLKEFLNGLEEHIRLFDITSFTFDQKMTTYNIILKTYYLENAQ